MQNQNLDNLQQLLRSKAELHARLQLLPYDGTPEIKTNKTGNKYLYVRKRIAGKLTSTYVDVFSDELYTALLRYSREARDLRKTAAQNRKRTGTNRLYRAGTFSSGTAEFRFCTCQYESQYL